MHVVIVGGTGLLGRHLVRQGTETSGTMTEGSETITVTGRGKQRPAGLSEKVRYHTWDTSSPFDLDEHVDAIVNVAGADIIGHRWTESYKRTLYDSRVETNRRLAEWIDGRDDPPSVFATSCAVGYYGRAPEGDRDEHSDPGDDFLARLCVDWESTCLDAASDRTRTVSFRQGVLLDGEEGALSMMLPAFKLGLGGKIGDGRQPFPWVSAHDAARAIWWALRQDDLQGPVNVVAPHVVTNKEFTETLGDVLNRPTVMTVPEFALTALFGDGATAITEGQRVVPRVLQDAGFSWDHPELDMALRAALGKGEVREVDVSPMG